MIDFYYKLEEKFLTFYLVYPIAIDTFFLSRMNELSLRITESGIKKLWKEKIPHESLIALRQRQYYENEEYLLNITDFFPAFYLLAFGVVFSGFVLTFEIFWRDFLGRFDWKNYKDKIKGSRRGLVSNYRVRFIQLHPTNESACGEI